MRNTVYVPALISACAVILASCASAAPATPAALPATQARLLAPASPTPAATAEPIGFGVPAVQDDHYGGQLVLASSLSGKPIAGTEAIPIADSYSYAFAPGGQSLALMSAATLYLIALPNWQVRKVQTDMHGSMSAMSYSADGSLLALASNDPDSALRILDAHTGETRASAQAGFAVHNLSFSADGKALMLYGPRLADSGQEANVGVSVGAPQAVLLSASDLSPLWSVKLNGVRDGTFPKPGATDLYQPGAAWHYSPGVAFVSQASLLYLVHGDKDLLTTVDFAARSVKTVAVHEKTGWIERLLGWGANVAYAKGMDGTTKQAVLSPDGTTLYVVGSTEAATKMTNGDWNITVTPLGLQAIDVQDGSLVQKLDTQADTAVLAPDGQHLLLLVWPQDSNRPRTEVYDLRTMKVTERLAGVRLLPARRADGAAVLQSSIMVTGNRCTMASVDSDSYVTLADWSGFPCANWLMDR